jgi:hypothetical protein
VATEDKTEQRPQQSPDELLAFLVRAVAEIRVLATKAIVQNAAQTAALVELGMGATAEQAEVIAERVAAETIATTQYAADLDLSVLAG